MRDTKEKLRLTWGSQQRVDSDHVRVPSPMIGQYTLDSRTNSIRDTGTRRKRRWYKMGNLHQFILHYSVLINLSIKYKSNCFGDKPQECVKTGPYSAEM